MILQNIFHDLSSVPTSDSPATTVTPCTMEALDECLQSWDVFLLKHSEINVRQQKRKLGLSLSAACVTDLWWQHVTHCHPEQSAALGVGGAGRM